MAKHTGYRQESATIPNDLRGSRSQKTALFTTPNPFVWTSTDAGRTLPAGRPFRFGMCESATYSFNRAMKPIHYYMLLLE